MQRAKAFVGDTIGQDTIVINVENGAYYSLSVEAGALWQLCEEGGHIVPTGMENVAAQLAHEGMITVDSGVLPTTIDEEHPPAFVKYTDMSDILLADPIHDVDEEGWPKLR